MNSGVPSYFTIDKSYQTIPIGHVSHYSVIVNEPNYDFFVLAGISNNELFSKLVMKNMNIREGRVFDTKLNNISSHLPTDKLKIITKNYKQYKSLINMLELFRITKNGSSIINWNYYESLRIENK